MKPQLVVIDLSLKNTWLYDGCEIHRPPNGGKKLRLDTPKAEASTIIRRNLGAWLRGRSNAVGPQGPTVLLEGSTLPWVAMIVRGIVGHWFATVLHQEKRDESPIEV